MKEFQSNAIILRQMDFKENDKLISFITYSQGKKSGIIRGSKSHKSRYGSSFEPLTCLQIFYTEKPHVELVSIKKADPIDAFYTLRNRYDRILLGMYFAELIDLCDIPEEEAPEFYNLLFGSLKALEQATTIYPIRFAYETNLLKIMGLFPELRRCVQCEQFIYTQIEGGIWKVKQPQDHQLDASEGSIRCPKCKRYGPGQSALSADSLYYALQHFRNENPSDMSPSLQVQQEWNAAFLSFFYFHTGRSPKSSQLLEQT